MLKFQEIHCFEDALHAYPTLQSLDCYYPKFKEWFHSNVASGFHNGNQKMIMATHDENIIGVALGKVSIDETKLQCVRVHSDVQNDGVGIKLIDRMLTLLEEEKPACTVSEEMLHLYSRAFVTRYGFSLNDVKKGVYRFKKLEYFFN